MITCFKLELGTCFFCAAPASIFASSFLRPVKGATVISVKASRPPKTKSRYNGSIAEWRILRALGRLEAPLPLRPVHGSLPRLGSRHREQVFLRRRHAEGAPDCRQERTDGGAARPPQESIHLSIHLPIQLRSTIVAPSLLLLDGVQPRIFQLITRCRCAKYTNITKLVEIRFIQKKNV